MLACVAAIVANVDISFNRIPTGRDLKPVESVCTCVQTLMSHI